MPFEKQRFIIDEITGSIRETTRVFEPPVSVHLGLGIPCKDSMSFAFAGGQGACVVEVHIFVVESSSECPKARASGRRAGPALGNIVF